MYKYPYTQCAAVRTHLGSINVPPHRDLVFEVTLTCQGNCPGTALAPFAIWPVADVEAATIFVSNINNAQTQKYIFC